VSSLNELSPPCATELRSTMTPNPVAAATGGMHGWLWLSTRCRVFAGWPPDRHGQPRPHEQAVHFAKLPGHEEATRLLIRMGGITATDEVLDVASQTRIDLTSTSNE
jgi:hypothetical protein